MYTIATTHYLSNNFSENRQVNKIIIYKDKSPINGNPNKISK